MKKFLRNTLHKIIFILARRTVRVYKPYIIAVTGSVGKTSAKEAIYAALRDVKRVRKTEANFNNELGVPLTILGRWNEIGRPVWWFWIKVIVFAVFTIVVPIKKRYPQVLVLEYGADKPGDIAYLVSIARPNIGVISAIGETPVHIEFYPSGVDAVVKEKAHILSSLGVNQHAILNADDLHTPEISKKTKAHIATYGFSDSADVMISHIRHTVVHNSITGISFKIRYKGSEIPFMIPDAFSIAHAYAVACAVTVVSEYLKINLVAIFESIARHYRPLSGRSSIIAGIKNTQIIDESYNSSPLALETALKTLQLVAHTRRVAVLGGMTELGKLSADAHEKIGTLVPHCVDVLITVGTRARLIARKAVEGGMYESAVHSFDTPQEAGLKLQEIMKAGDIVLIKASHSIGLEKVVEEVKV
jgi:UDP-N-acetylmuramoyl-tripeptide--D-alanyl-D-alanine ligase